MKAIEKSIAILLNSIAPNELWFQNIQISQHIHNLYL